MNVEEERPVKLYASLEHRYDQIARFINILLDVCQMDPALAVQRNFMQDGLPHGLRHSLRQLGQVEDEFIKFVQQRRGPVTSQAFHASLFAYSDEISRTISETLILEKRGLETLKALEYLEQMVDRAVAQMQRHWILFRKVDDRGIPIDAVIKMVLL